MCVFFFFLFFFLTSDNATHTNSYFICINTDTIHISMNMSKKSRTYESAPILLSTEQMLNKLLFTVALNSDQHTETTNMPHVDYGGTDRLALQSYSLTDCE